MDVRHGVILDFETTGFRPEEDGILQMAAVALDLRTGRELDRFATPLQQDWTTVPAHIRKLTGLRSEDLSRAPAPAQALQELARFAAQADWVIAHNARRCEIPFLRSACQRHGLAVREVPAWDTVDLSLRLWGHGVRHDLDAVLQRLGIPTQGLRRHDARDDATLLTEALRRMLDRLNITSPSSALPGFPGVLPA